MHNFFYIAWALAFTHLNDPFTWFVPTAFYAVVVWLLSFTIWDGRLAFA